MVKTALFYAGDGLVDYIDPGWLQLAFDMLTGLFDRVGLRKNFPKTVGMVYKPFRVARVRADEAYTQQTTGEGQSFKER